MADPHGFLTIEKKKQRERPTHQRIKDWKPIYLPLVPVERDREVSEQARRCMDCGVPFCHALGPGCPLGNLIPEWNDLVRRKKWDLAMDRLHATNNFPEFTGKICPAPCEAACVLSIDAQVTGGCVAIKRIEDTIVERAWETGKIVPQISTRFTGKKVAIVGSGPAGLAAAQQLTRVGHSVTVYERDDRIGGLLRYGIPEYKLEKSVIDRRLLQMHAEGTKFVTGAEIGVDISVDQLRKNHDAVVLAVGALQGRDSKDIPGRNLSGVHLAMDYLVQANRMCEGEKNYSLEKLGSITAKDKHVVIIGGGDTGADCLGTAHRQGALSVTQLDYNRQPPHDNNEQVSPWPTWPLILRNSSSHDEGGERKFEVAVRGFIGNERGIVTGLKLSRVKLDRSTEQRIIVPIGEEIEIPCDLALFAIGFEGIDSIDLLDDLGIDVNDRGTIDVDSRWSTSVSGVFACGDAHRGASLVVWAIAEGRSAAYAVDRYLMGHSELPEAIRPSDGVLRP